MKKRILALTLALVFCFTVLGMTVSAATTKSVQSFDSFANGTDLTTQGFVPWGSASTAVADSTTKESGRSCKISLTTTANESNSWFDLAVPVDTNWTGAVTLKFWLKTWPIEEGQSTAVNIQFTTADGANYTVNDSVKFQYESSPGTFVERSIAGGGLSFLYQDFPNGYEGWIKLPLNSLTRASWTPGPDDIDFANMASIHVGTAAVEGKVMWVDSISLLGSNLVLPTEAPTPTPGSNPQTGDPSSLAFAFAAIPAAAGLMFTLRRRK